MVLFARFWMKGKFSMNPMSTEWVAKAEGDFAMVEREYRARKNLNFDARKRCRLFCQAACLSLELDV